MAIVFTLTCTPFGSTTNTGVYSMAPQFTPTANAKIIVLANASATATGSISGAGGIAWNLRCSANPQASGYSSRLYDGNAGASPGATNINAEYTGDNATGCAILGLQVTGHDLTYDVPRQTVVVDSIGNNPSVTFNPAINSGDAALVAILFTGAVGRVTAPAGWSTLAASFSSPAAGAVLAYANAVTGTTFTFSTGAVTGMGYFGAEYYYSGGVPQGPVGNAVPLLMRQLVDTI